MTIRKSSLLIVAVGAALAVFAIAGAACASDQPEPEPATPIINATTVVPSVAPTPTAVPAAAAAPPAASDQTSAIAPRRSGGTPAPAPAAPATPPNHAMTAADFPTPPDRNLLQLARQLRWNGVEPTPEPPRFAGRELQVGDTAEFWTLDYPQRKMVRKELRLAAVSQRAYWWVEPGLKVDDADLRRTVADAEALVYPRVTAVFGDLPELSADGKRGHIINAEIPRIGGYVSGADPYPATVQPYSNEVPAIYINADAVPLGSAQYLNVLAHELQHAIHWYADPAEATWLNEGLSELAVTEAGLAPGSIDYYLRRPNASLVNWPAELGGDVGLNYGAAALFAHYLRERYAPEGDLLDLLAGPRNGIAAVDDFLKQRGAVAPDGAPADFHSLFADWMVANLLDSDAGGYGYAGLEVAASITRTRRVDDASKEASLPQYGIDYIELTNVDGEIAVHFAGAGVTPLLPVAVPVGGCWWSNRGDDISSTLTRSFVIPDGEAGSPEPALSFNLWHDIEKDWDYLYAAVSTDGGATWTTLPAAGATDANPLGNSYGHGYTGAGDWREVTVSLAEYAGQDALVRFHYVTDDAIHGPGACLRDLRVSWDAAGAWQPDGFVLVNNQVRQEWIVWLVRDGAHPTATRLALDWDAGEQRYTAAARVPATDDGGRLIVAVAPTAPATMEPGQYRIWATKAE